MKKIYGIFRGFPGLGRVSAGIAILKTLDKQGHQVGAISYFQGIKALKEQDIPILVEYNPKDIDITSIGINPITEYASLIAKCIMEGKPDLIIFDGEPLLQSVLGDVFPKRKMISLLNPSDLYNDSLQKFKVNFYRRHYLSCGNAIVHGIGMINETTKVGGCTVHHISTIIRDEILNITVTNESSKRIVGLLGGGTVNSSMSFLQSTVDMGIKMASIARIMKHYNFDVYCNDDHIKKAIEEKIYDVPNINIVSEYTSPRVIYEDACFAMVRAGRNVASELLYLNIPGLLIATSGDYRSKEQDKNIELMIKTGGSLFDKFTLNDDDALIVEKIKKMLEYHANDKLIYPGNEMAINIINNVLEN